MLALHIFNVHNTNLMLGIESLREFRIAEYAVFDFVVSFVVIYLLAPYLSKLFLKLRVSIPRKSWVYLTLPLGMLIHVLVGSITPMTADLIDLQGHVLVKVFILALTYLGVKDMSIIKSDENGGDDK